MTRTVEQSREIGVNWCNREGLLEPGASGVLRWTRASDGEETASVGYTFRSHCSHDVLELQYTIANTYLDIDPREVTCSIPIDYTECHFGGERPWFRCPRCDERVGKLYSVPGHDRYICRECGGLLYKSQTYRTPLVESFDRLAKAKERAKDELFNREALREYYDALKGVNEGYQANLERMDNKFPDLGGDGPSRAEQFGGDPVTLPPFEDWLDRLFYRPYINENGRAYGYYGRCTATAKSTDERCRQPACGDHRKCYYHGGAPRSGIGEGQTDHAAKRVSELIGATEQRDG